MPAHTTRSIIFRHHRVSKARKEASQARTAWLARIIALLVLVSMVFTFFVTAVFASASAATAVAFRSITSNLPSVTTIGTTKLPETTMIFDRNGVLLYEAVDPKEGKRTSIPLSAMPTDLIKATIAVEDPSFFENPGVDVRGILRALLSNYQAGRVTSGASTITQQLVKNSLLTSEVSYTRKIKEAVLAYRLSRMYSKEQLLEFYLNQNNYGNHAYGVEAAAEAYFGRPAKDLTLAECSLLAGLPQAPSVYNPVVNRSAAKQRQREVLDAMVRRGMVEQDVADRAFETPLTIKRSETVLKAPHFVFYVLDELVKKFGADAVYKGGLRVRTTLDYGLQQNAEKIAQRQVESVKTHNVTDAAVVAINPKTGEIVTMLGSVDYENDAIDGKFNVATARRQPGSSIKPMTYATAFQKGWTPSTVIVDSKTEFPVTSAMWMGSYVPRPGDPKPYAPQNYDEKFHGPMSVRKALGNSMNIPAVKALMFAGVDDTIETSRRLGITTFDRGANVYGLSLTLGGGEVRLLDITSAYGVFAAGGVRHAPAAWLSVTDRNGKTLDALKVDRGDQVMSPQVAFLTTSVLSDDDARALEFGTNSGLKLSRPSAAKTGTTDSFRDNWTVGYTPNLVTGVWVGNANNDKMIDIIGITGAGPIWHDFMEDTLKPLPVEDFTVPTGIVKTRASDLTGLLPSGGTPVSAGGYRWTIGPDGQRKYEFDSPATSLSNEPSHDDWFIQGTEPTRRTYRTDTYKAYWGTGQIAAANCPTYMVDERVYGADPPPPGVFDCVKGISSYIPGPGSFPASLVGGANAYPTVSPQRQAEQVSSTLAASFPPAQQTAISGALTPVAIQAVPASVPQFVAPPTAPVIEATAIPVAPAPTVAPAAPAPTFAPIYVPPAPTARTQPIQPIIVSTPVPAAPQPVPIRQAPTVAAPLPAATPVPKR